jgi:hypothetical protein
MYECMYVYIYLYLFVLTYLCFLFFSYLPFSGIKPILDRILMHTVDAMTYDVGTIVCDGDYSCYGSYLNGVRKSVECSGERACADITTTAGGAYFVISPFNNDGNIFDKGFNGSDYSDGISVTCDRKSTDGESVCGYFYEFLYSPETLSRTKIDVGVNGKLTCQADFNGKDACEYIAFGGLNKTKNAQCSNIGKK